ncbi:substrate-binding domain-containing protein [Shinella sp.]|uniref:substrate-binding domain-containing protein n=1 Tax=Shinella sp. TaxID=1870904 RepID=UPI00301D321B
MSLHVLKKALATMVVASLPMAALADNTEGVKHPLWYKEPSEKTMKLAAIDDLTDVVVSDGQRGEEGFPASKIADLEAISVLKPDLLVSIPLNGKTTASAYKRLAEAGTKVVFIDQAVEGMDPGKDYAAIISSDNLALGMYLADLLAESIDYKGNVAALYFANDFYVTNLRYEGFIARLRAKYPDVKLVAAAGHDDPNKGQEVAQGVLARYPDIDGMYASWSIPAMGAVTAANVNGRTPADFKIVNENFDQIVALNMAQNGFIAGISSQRPYDQGTAEAKIGALTLIGETVPPYVVVPPLAVKRANLPQSYKTIYRIDLPQEMNSALSQ